MCYELFYLLKQHYEKYVLVIDYRRLTTDLLKEWSETMVDHCGTAQDFMFFIDGKPCRAYPTGTSKETHEKMRQVGDENVNFVQMAYCDGHYGMCGLKVSSFLKADGVRHTIRNHYIAVVLLH